MSRALTIFFGLLALGILAYVCIGQHRPEIQAEVAANTRGELVANGYPFARVSADGQHVTLTGTAPSDESRIAAGRAALGAHGVVAVDNQITVETLVPPPGPDPTPIFTPEPVPAAVPAPVVAAEPVTEVLQIVLDGATRRAGVAGQVVSASALTELGAALTTALPDWEISNGTTTVANAPLDLEVAVQQLLPPLTVAERASLDVDAQGIRVIAQLGSFSQRSALAAQLEEISTSTAFAERNLTWTLDSPPASVDGCQTAFDELLAADTILFTTSKAAIRGSSLPLLDKLARVARDCEVSVDIGGHTDSRGSAEFNDYLSLERARAVRNYLIAHGVDGDRITAQGFGATNPIADNNTIDGRQKNRRIEFRVRTES